MIKKKSHVTGKNSPSGFEGILRGFSDLVNKLGELAEKGEQLSKTGEVHWQGEQKDLKGVFGFSIKTGLGGQGVKVEPFGNIHKDKATGHSVVQEIREPLVDVFEEEDYVLVIAEMPGVGAEDIRLDVKDDVLIIEAEKGDKKYRKEVMLPGNFSREKMLISCNNGLLEIKCTK